MTETTFPGGEAGAGQTRAGDLADEGVALGTVELKRRVVGRGRDEVEDRLSNHQKREQHAGS